MVMDKVQQCSGHWAVLWGTKHRDDGSLKPTAPFPIPHCNENAPLYKQISMANFHLLNSRSETEPHHVPLAGLEHTMQTSVCRLAQQNFTCKGRAEFYMCLRCTVPFSLTVMQKNTVGCAWNPVIFTRGKPLFALKFSLFFILVIPLRVTTVLSCSSCKSTVTASP